MVRVRVQADIGKAREVLTRIADAIQTTRPLMDIAGGILENSIRDRFRTGSGPGGIPWKPSHRALAQSGRTLIDTGGLLNSITHVADEGRVEVGVIAKTPSAKHAATHQFGAHIVPVRAPYLVFTGPDGHKVFAKAVDIPARPFIGIDDADRADLQDAWTAYLEAL
jgi:phage gpG-like protein